MDPARIVNVPAESVVMDPNGTPAPIAPPSTVEPAVLSVND